MMMSRGWVKVSGRILPAVLVGFILGACQPSAENRALENTGMTAEDPNFYPSDDHLRMAKVYFRNGDFGSAEAQYRSAVEAEPKDTEAWVGLAASLDQLRRFDLADKAYQHVLVLGNNNAIVMNNAGYSELLRGNIPAARKFLLRAYELDPQNPYIVNNLALLGESGKTIKRASL